MGVSQRQVHNALKLVLIAILAVVIVALLAFALFWPMLLYYSFGQPLAVAVTITIVWMSAWL